MPAAQISPPEQVAYTVELYSEKYKDQVLQLWMECFGRRSYNLFQRDLAAAHQRTPCLFYLATTAKALLGTCVGSSDGHRSWIYYLCVAKAARRQGIATRLLKLVEDKLQAEGNNQIGIHTPRTNYSAIDFYRVHGYSIDEATTMGKVFD